MARHVWTVTATAEDAACAVRQDGKGNKFRCAIVCAFWRTYPELTHVSVREHSIAFTDKDTDERLTWVVEDEPSVANALDAALSWDTRGAWPEDGVTIRLRRGRAQRKSPEHRSTADNRRVIDKPAPPAARRQDSRRARYLAAKTAV